MPPFICAHLRNSAADSMTYFAKLTTGKIALWCYLIWDIEFAVRYFDSSRNLWLTSLGLSAIIGLALILGTSGAHPRPLAALPPLPHALLRLQLRRAGRGPRLHPRLFPAPAGKPPRARLLRRLLRLRRRSEIRAAALIPPRYQGDSKMAFPLSAVSPLYLAAA